MKKKFEREKDEEKFAIKSRNQNRCQYLMHTQINVPRCFFLLFGISLKIENSIKSPLGNNKKENYCIFWYYVLFFFLF